MHEREPLFVYVWLHYGPTVLYHAVWEKAEKKNTFQYAMAVERIYPRPASKVASISVFLINIF